MKDPTKAIDVIDNANRISFVPVSIDIVLCYGKHNFFDNPKYLESSGKDAKKKILL